MPLPHDASNLGRENSLRRFFSGLFGGFLALALLKFGNPPIMESWVNTPRDIYEFVIGFPWPISWAYAGLAALVVLALFCRPARPPVPGVVLALPAAWLLWQWLSGTRSIDPALSGPTLKHFTAAVACFYLGAWVLARQRSLWPFWLPILASFSGVVAIGWYQHFGGLEDTRRYFYLYIYPTMTEVPPEYLKKISSDRIFGTMFYPNALAGILLLLLPPLLVVIWRMDRWMTAGARAFLAAVLALGSLGCLYWSGSKGGWLLMLVLLVAALFRTPLKGQLKAAVLTVLLVGGLAGFFWKYSTFFQRGATSVSSRFDYWRAALHTAYESPIFGSGPGTFGVAYAKIKKPESEPSRLAHNDYLQQASDSGLPGFGLYAAFIVTVVFGSFRRASTWVAAQPSSVSAWQQFAIWLGAAGWVLQSLSEFGLYLPAISWCAFALLGWLVAQPDRSTVAFGAARQPASNSLTGGVDSTAPRRLGRLRAPK